MSEKNLISEDVLKNMEDAIVQSLEEEKKPFIVRSFKTLLAFVCLAVLSGSIFLKIAGTEAVVSCFLWTAIGVIALYFYLQPQPKIEVQNYWSRWVLAKLALVSLVTTVFTFLVCPHFVIMHQEFSWGLLRWLPSRFMDLGGPATCMLFCGCFFSVLGNLLSFSFVSRTLSFQNFRQVVRPILVSFLTQTPLLSFQLMNEHLRSYLAYWLVGSIIGIVLSMILIEVLCRLIRRSLLHSA